MPLQKIPKPAIFLNRCCRLHNIFGTYKIKRNVYPQSSDCHAKHIFTQRLVSGFYFTTDFSQIRNFSTKIIDKVRFGFQFSRKIFSNNLFRKNRREAFSVSSENILYTTFRGLKIVAKNQHQAFTNITKTLN